MVMATTMNKKKLLSIKMREKAYFVCVKAKKKKKSNGIFFYRDSCLVDV